MCKQNGSQEEKNAADLIIGTVDVTDVCEVVEETIADVEGLTVDDGGCGVGDEANR